MSLSIGFDLGGTTMTAALVDSGGRIVALKEIETLVEKGRSDVIRCMIELLEEMAATAREQQEPLKGIGMGIAGLIDYRQGLVHTSPNFPDWKDVALASLVEKALQLPVRMDNDVRAAALGEWNFGAGRGCRDLFCMTVGTGVGSALILNNQLYRGSTLSAGEFGHMVMVPQGGRLCGCGSRGCLETIVGNKALIERGRQILNKGISPSLQEIVHQSGGQLSPAHLSQAAWAGDEATCKIWQETGEWIGIALTNLVNLLNPEKIILGGGIAQAGELLLQPIRETIRLRAFSLPAQKAEVVLAQLGNQAGLVGATVLLG